MKFFTVLALGILTSHFALANEFKIQSVSEIQSMVLRSDGNYDVICKNGSTEVATIYQIQSNQVCRGEVVEPTSEIEAVFSRPQGDFFVLCKNKSWLVATAKMIEEGTACPGLAELPSGVFFDQRSVRLEVSIDGTNIVLKWPHADDGANGNYVCSGKPALCIHERGYRVIVTGHQEFTWEPSMGASYSLQFRVKDSLLLMQ